MTRLYNPSLTNTCTRSYMIISGIPLKALIFSSFDRLTYNDRLLLSSSFSMTKTQDRFSFNGILDCAFVYFSVLHQLNMSIKKSRHDKKVVWFYNWPVMTQYQNATHSRREIVIITSFCSNSLEWGWTTLHETSSFRYKWSKFTSTRMSSRWFFSLFLSEIKLAFSLCLIAKRKQIEKD